MGTRPIKEDQPGRIEPGEQGSESPSGLFIPFYRSLPDFFLEYLKRLTQRLIVGFERDTLLFAEQCYPLRVGQVEVVTELLLEGLLLLWRE